MVRGSVASAVASAVEFGEGADPDAFAQIDVAGD
jgi:hypothetical protein